jgi:hypothetical protein
MNAHSHQFTDPEVPTWGDRVTLARNNPALAFYHIDVLMREARELVEQSTCAADEWKAIADAAETWLDCPCDCCLHEIDALLFPDEEPAFHPADAGPSFGTRHPDQPGFGARA